MAPSRDDYVYVPTATSPGIGLTYAQVAQSLGVSIRTVMRWVKQGCIPSPRYLGQAAVFPLDYVDPGVWEGVFLPGTYPVARSCRSKPKKRAKGAPGKKKGGK